MRNLNAAFADDVWEDIHSTRVPFLSAPETASIHVFFIFLITPNSNRPHQNNPDNGSNFSPSQGAQSGTQRRLQGVDLMSNENPPIFVSGPVESIHSVGLASY